MRYSKNSKFLFRFLGLILLVFQFQFLSAQETSTGENSDTAIMYVDKSLQIFSADENFNKNTQVREIVATEIVSEKSTISVQSSALLKKKKTDSLQLNFSKELQNIEEQKAKIVSEEIKQKQESLEVENTLVKTEFHRPVSSDDFLGSQKISKDYVSQRPCNQEVCKNICFCEPVFIKKALSHLHTQKFFYYNNKSFDDCFSNVFSVRPPPIIA